MPVIASNERFARLGEEVEWYRGEKSVKPFSSPKLDIFWLRERKAFLLP
jgi:hypothetical protein